MRNHRATVLAVLLLIGSLLLPRSATAATARIYVTDWNSGQLYVLDAGTYAEVGRIQLSGFPGRPALSPDEKYVYVGCWADNRVYEIDAATLSITRSFGVQRMPADLAVTPDGRKLYVVNRLESSISSIDLASGTVRTVFSQSSPQLWSILTASDGKAYVSTYGAIHVFDTATDTKTDTLPGTGGPGDLGISPIGDRLYAADGNSGELAVIDLLNGTKVATVAGSSQHGSGLTISPDGALVFMTHSNTGGGVSVFNAGTLTLVDRYPSNAIYPEVIARDERGDCLYVRSLRSMTVLRASDGAVFTSIEFPDKGSLTIGSGEAVCGQQVDPQVTWNPSPLTYGQLLGPPQLNATSDVSGVFTYDPPSGTLLAAGTHELHALFTPADTSRYRALEVTAIVTVAPAAPVLSWASPVPIVIGTSLGPSQLNATANVAGVFTYEPGAGVVLPVGAHTLVAAFTPSDPNYMASSITAQLLVTHGICVAYDPSRPVRAGSTLPLKVMLCDAAGNNMSSAGLGLMAQSVVRISDDVSGEVQDSGNANPDANFRYSADLDGYIYNLQTTGLAGGTYAVTVRAGTDAFVHKLFFQVK